MTITYPREKRKIKLSNNAGVIYVIFGRGIGECWWIQDFWGLPYVFGKYEDARVGAKKISAMMGKYHWEDQKAVIAKVSL